MNIDNNIRKTTYSKTTTVNKMSISDKKIDMLTNLKYSSKNGLSVKQISYVIINHLELSKTTMYSSTRGEYRYSHIRHIIWWICSQYGHNKSVICREFKRHNASVQHGINKVSFNKSVNETYNKFVYDLKEVVDNHMLGPALPLPPPANILVKLAKYRLPFPMRLLGRKYVDKK